MKRIQNLFRTTGYEWHIKPLPTPHPPPPKKKANIIITLMPIKKYLYFHP